MSICLQSAIQNVKNGLQIENSSKQKLRANMHVNVGNSLPLCFLYLETLYKGMTAAKLHEEWLTKAWTGDLALSQ